MKADIKLTVEFYKSGNGQEPVRRWLKGLPKQDKQTIGNDIKTVQYGWPIGMPLVKDLGKGIKEVRISLDNRIARILFCTLKEKMILLHGFIKKTEETPKPDLDLALKRKKEVLAK